MIKIKEIAPEILDIQQILAQKNQPQSKLNEQDRVQIDDLISKGVSKEKILKAIDMSEMDNKELAKQYVQNV